MAPYGRFLIALDFAFIVKVRIWNVYKSCMHACTRLCINRRVTMIDGFNLFRCCYSDTDCFFDTSKIKYFDGHFPTFVYYMYP